MVSDVPLDVLLQRLRELGSAPVVEAPDGTVRLARRETHRARSPRPRARAEAVPVSLNDARTAARFGARVAATVTAVRAGDRVAEQRPARGVATAGTPGGRPSPADVLAALREAAEADSPC